MATETIVLEQAKSGQLDEIALPGGRAPFSVWRRMIEAEARQVRIELAAVRTAGPPYPEGSALDFDWLLAEACREVTDAVAVVRRQWPKGFWNRVAHMPYEFLCIWSGSEHETSWAALHRAEGLLILMMPDDKLRIEAAKMETIFRTSTDVPADDPRHTVYQQLFDRVAGPEQVTPPHRPGQGRMPRDGPPVAEVVADLREPRAPVVISIADREQLLEIRREQYEAWEIARSRVRIFRNILAGVIPFLSLVLVALALVAWADPGLIPLRSAGADGGDIALIECLGAFGGLLSGVWALSALRNFQRFYGLPLAQIILKVPAGAATALAGVLLLQHGLLGSVGPLVWEKVLPYAVLFGVAQVAVTRAVDSRARDLLGSANTKSPAPSSTAPAAPSLNETA